MSIFELSVGEAPCHNPKIIKESDKNWLSYCKWLRFDFFKAPYIIQYSIDNSIALICRFPLDAEGSVDKGSKINAKGFGHRHIHHGFFETRIYKLQNHGMPVIVRPCTPYSFITHL